jgi:four helix bundle protein
MNDEALMTNDERMTKSENREWRAEDSFWNGSPEAVVREEPEASRVYDLEERTARFGEAVIDFARAIPQDAVTNRITNQLVGAATSIGANYVEADDAVSKKEFLKSIGTCKKRDACGKALSAHGCARSAGLKREARKLWLETRQLHLIFSKIWRSGKNES